MKLLTNLQAEILDNTLKSKNKIAKECYEGMSYATL